VAVSSNTIQALEEREWIRVVGHRDVPGKPALFGTTKIFLDYFGLKRLDELPPLSELKDIGELEPQLFMDDAPVPAGLPDRESAQASDDDAEDNEELQAANDEPRDDDANATDGDEQDIPSEDDAFEEEISSQAIDDEEHSLENQDETEGADSDSLDSSEQKQ
jgi:segregation and condensation protein B